MHLGNYILKKSQKVYIRRQHKLRAKKILSSSKTIKKGKYSKEEKWQIQIENSEVDQSLTS